MYLHDVRPELCFLVSALDLGDLQYPRSQRKVVDSTAGSESCGEDGWLRDKIHGNQISHSLKSKMNNKATRQFSTTYLSDLPPINVFSVKVCDISGIELCVTFNFSSSRHQSDLTHQARSGNIGPGGSPQAGACNLCKSTKHFV